MVDVILKKVNEVYLQVIAEPSIKQEMSEQFTFFVPNAKFMDLYKNKVWDGKKRLLNVITGFIYAGLYKKIIEFCEKNDYTWKLDGDFVNEETVDYEEAERYAVELGSTMKPRDYQSKAYQICMQTKRCVILSPTASGKSFIIYLVANKISNEGKRVLISVPTINLVNQLRSDFIDYGGDEKTIQTIAEGTSRTIEKETKFVISTWQSIHAMKDKWFGQFDAIIGDEAHLFSAKSLCSIMEKGKHMEYRIGLSGSLDASVVNKLTLIGLFGPVWRVEKTANLIEKGTLADLTIHMMILKHANLDGYVKKKVYADEIDWIVKNEDRNKFIVNLTKSLEGNTLILFGLVEKHGKNLNKMLTDAGLTVYFIHGEVKGTERERIRKLVETERGVVILASEGTFSTGANIVNINNLIMVAPGKSVVRILQSIGRVLRKGGDKQTATVFDISDDLRQGKSVMKNYSLAHMEERVKIYSKEGFKFKIHNINIGEK